jgi:hypothetical protein
MPVSLSKTFSPLKANHSAAANEERNGNRSLPAVPAYQGSEKPIQMAVSHSATYAPGGASVGEIAALDGLVPAAEAAANTDVMAPIGGYVHTPSQAAYMLNPTPARWGCCVEEKLNITAPGLGWTNQWPLPGSRPDYRKVVGGNKIYVDLTSALQAGVGGNHITAKLITGAQGVPKPHWHGADITHASLHPLGGIGAVVPNTNGPVTHLHMLHFQNFRGYLDNPHGNWTPFIENLLQYYGHVTTPTFTQVWNLAQRNLFVARAQTPWVDEGGSSEEYSEDDNSMSISSDSYSDSDSN